MPRPLSVAGVTNNGFKDCRPASQITTSLSACFTASSSLTRCLGNFPVGHPSQDCSPASTLNCRVLKCLFPKRKGTSFCDISNYFDPFKLHLGCYNHPHLKCTISSLCLTNRLTYESSWPAIHTQYLCPTKWLPMGSPSTGATHGRGSALIPSVMPHLSRSQVLPIMVLRIVDWPHKSPQVFPMYFVLAHMLPEKLPTMSPIPRLLPSTHT